MAWKIQVRGKDASWPRNLFSTILHGGSENSILFVLNHYVEATRCRPTLKEGNDCILEDSQTGERP